MRRLLAFANFFKVYFPPSWVSFTNDRVKGRPGSVLQNASIEFHPDCRATLCSAVGDCAFREISSMVLSDREAFVRYGSSQHSRSLVRLLQVTTVAPC